MAIIGDGKSGIVCDDTLDKFENWNEKTKSKIQLNYNINVLLTNPPFGSKIPVRGEDKLKQYDLGYRWKKNSETGKWEKTNKLKDKEAPQILFIERCVQLLKPGGRCAIVLPDGILGNQSLGYVRQWLLEKCRIVAIIDVPIETFMPNTSTKTSILIFQKNKNDEQLEDYSIFMAIAEKCGHDRRGRELNQNDLNDIPNLFKLWCKENSFNFQDN